MAATTLPNNGIQYAWALGEDNWNTGMDANLLKIDTLLQGSVKDYTITTPPGSPTSGDRYIVATGSTGSWNGQDGKLALYINAVWSFYTPQNGWLVKDINSGRLIGYNGSAWVLDPLGDRAYSESLLTGLWNDRGNFSAAGGAYPSSGGSGTAGAIKKGDIWTISVAGTLPTSQVVEVGDTVRALQDTPGNTQANWAIGQNNIGYVAENSANKDSSTSLGSSNTLYPTQGAVKTYVDTAISNNTTDLSTVVERVTNFRQRNVSNYFYPYTITSGSSTITQSTVAGITGYEKAGGGQYISTNSTSASVVCAITIEASGTGTQNLHDTFWTTGGAMQTMIYASPMVRLPSGSDDFEYRFGLFYNAYYNGTSAGNQACYSSDPFASIDATSSNDRAAAYFYVDKNSGFWKCKSGSDATTETTTTSVTAAINQMVALRVKVGTTGAVQFWIDGTLVATHSTGVITSGKQLSEAVCTYNNAIQTNATHGWFVSSMAFRQTLPTARTGFAFI